MTTRSFVRSLQCAAFFAAASGLLTQTSARAQDVPPASPNHPATRAVVEHGVCETEQGFVGIGPGYRVDFGSGSFRYVPALGRRAPRTMPLSLTLTSAGRDDALERGPWLEQRPGRRDGNRVARRLTNGLTERVEMHAHGAELTYRLDRLPSGNGDFTVRLRAVSDLVGARSERGPGLVFEAPGLGGVRIGGVTGIDAAGRRTPGEIHHDGEFVSLSLPGWFLESASYPVVLDPIFTTEWPGPGLRARTPDSALDDGRVLTARRVFVWAEEFSALHSEIRGVSGAVPFLIRDVATRFAIAPKIAFVRGANQMVVAWQEAPSALGPWAIACASVTQSVPRASPTRLVREDLQTDPTVDLAGTRTLSGTQAILVAAYTGEGLRGTLVTPAGTSTAPQLGSSALLVADSGTTARVTPAISRAVGNGNRLLLAWRDAPPNASGSVSARVVRSDLSSLGTTRQLAVGAFAPDVDGDGTEFLVAWETTPAGTAGPRDISCNTLRWDGSSLRDTGSASDFANDRANDERDVSVGFEPEGFVLAWSRDDPGGRFLDREVVATVFLTDRCARCRAVIEAEDRGRDENALVLTNWPSAFDPGSASIDRIAHTAQDLTIPFGTRLYAGRFGLRATSGLAQISTGDRLGQGGTALPTSDFSWRPASAPGLVLGSTSFRFRLAGAVPNQPTVLQLDFGSGNYAICSLSTTVLLGDVSINLATNSAGFAAFGFPIPCDPQLLTLTIGAQWVTLAPGNPLTCFGPPLNGAELAASTRVFYSIGG